MKPTSIFFGDIDSFGARDKAFKTRPEGFKALYPYKQNIEAVEEIANKKAAYFRKEQRELLVSVLQEQYAESAWKNKVSKQLDLLSSENTFTVCSAHQPVIFGGPLYTIYKIASSINYVARLNKQYPDKNFIPLYIIGSEDHDFEEISHFYLFGQKYTWTKDGDIGGAVGRMPLDGINPLVEEVLSKFSRAEHRDELEQLLRSSYHEQNTVAQACRNFYQYLFQNHGLVILDMDDGRLKQQMLPLFEREIKDSFSLPLIKEKQKQISTLGFKPQIYPREINLFYTLDDKRSRIERNGKNLVVQDQVYTEEEMINLLQNNPSKFSANVALRPLFQETCLPNVAFIGGGAEMAYWLEISSVFEECNVRLPQLLRRNSFFLAQSKLEKSLNGLGFSLLDILKHQEKKLENQLLESENVDLELTDKWVSYFKDGFDSLSTEMDLHDKGLKKSIAAQEALFHKFLSKLNKQVVRSHKAKHATSLNTLKKAYKQLLPDNKAQERTMNILPYLADYGLDIIDKLVHRANPLNMDVDVLILE